jgi:hypothetical protein
LNEDFGFHVNRPFYLVSALPINRVLELQGGHNLKLYRYVKGRTEQQFYFDGVSKTIKSQRYKDRSIEVNSNGNASTTRMTTTNSRWW